MMTRKRQSISKTLRFEVFKRDKFTCQYCGRMAPDVVLEIDHITPVKEGGNNDILNLVTSCKDCNRGKGCRKISQRKELDIQQDQLKELAERREQLEFLVKWREELKSIEELQLDAIDQEIQRYSPNYQMGQVARNAMLCTLRKFGLQEVLIAVNISFPKYYHPDEYWEKESWSNAFNKIGGICWNRKQQGQS